jgi:hypothetical protein
LIVLRVGLAWCAVIAAHGQQTIVLPPVDLAPTETAQVNIMSSAANYSGWSFVETCQVSVTFYGAGGSALTTPATFTVGKAPLIVSVQLPHALTDDRAAVAPVTAQIVLTPPSQGSFSTASPPIPACPIAFSLQTFDTATGATHAFVPGQAAETRQSNVGGGAVLPCLYPGNICDSVYGYLPSQVIVLPPVSLTTTETAQVDLVSSADGFGGSLEACIASVTFYGADGSAIGAPANFAVDKTSRIFLPAGKAPRIFSAQLPYAATGAKSASTAVSAQIALTPITIPIPYRATAPPCVIVFSMKTFDAATHVTHAYVAGQSMPAASNPVTGTTNTNR